MKQKTGRKLLSFILTLAMVVGLLPGMSLTAYADNDPVDYRTATVDGTTHAVTFSDQQCTDYTVVTASTTALEDGKWYVVNADVTINERITVDGTANLILVDGKTLTANEGITVSTDKTLNIYGQNGGTGTLIANASCVVYDSVRIIHSAAIGGYIRMKANRDEDEEYEVEDGQPIFYFLNCGTINIYGGVITANGNCPGDNTDAGIGGVSSSSEYGQGGNVTVYGGNVTAIGGMYGAGIGAVLEKGPHKVTVYGGIIHASGGEDAMGIGKGDSGQDNGNLTVASTHIAYSHTAAITNDNKDTADKMQGTGTESTITRKRYMLVEPGPAPDPGPEDIVISPASGDIAQALAAAEEGKTVGNITINLTEGVTYTISNTIVAPASLTIHGNGATIDADSLNAPMIALAEIKNPTGWKEINIAVSGVKVEKLKKQMFYSGYKNYLCNTFTVDDCVVEVVADVTTFDFTKGSTAMVLELKNSTFYAPAATTKSFYSSQSGQKVTEFDAEAIQTFTFKGNTIYPRCILFRRTSYKIMPVLQISGVCKARVFILIKRLQ